jgi:hippurate hydrolase
MQKITSSICAAYGADFVFEFEHRYPATVNTKEEAELSGKIAQKISGEAMVNLAPTPSMGSEDFAYMLQEKPGSYIWIGNGDGEGSCMIHNPGYDFNDEILPIGATYWVEMAEEILSPIS